MANGVPSAVSIRDYIEASKESSTRTRLAFLAIVFTGVLTFIGLLNSLPNSWLTHRFQNLKQISSNPYLESQIGPLPSPSSPEFMFYKARYDHYASAVTNTYVETSNLVHVPIFGISLDINDLGILSGIAFVISQLWLWFCIKAEGESLAVSFAQAERSEELPQLYELLAMRQALSLPPQMGPDSEKQSRTTRMIRCWLPKALCIVPLVQVLVTLTDWSCDSRDVLYKLRLSPSEIYWRLGLDIFFSLLIIMLSVFTLVSWFGLDKQWSDRWSSVRRAEAQSPSS